MRLLLCIFFLVSVATPAHAGKAEERKAKKLFAQGNRAFDEGRYSDALAAYRESYEQVQRPSTLFNIATCRDRLGDAEGAYVDYERFIAAEKPDAPLVAEAKKRVEELRASLTLPVDVASSPAGARIRVDGADTIAAQTPATLNLSVGAHTLTFDAPQHRGATRTVEVVPGARARVDATLDPLGTVVLSADPPEAVIEIAGHEPAPGRLTKDLDPGRYSVAIRLDGHKDANFELDLVGGAVVTRHVTLQPIVVAPPPPPAPIRVDRGGGLRNAGLVTGIAGVVMVGVAVQQGFAAKGYSDDAQRAAMDMRFDHKAFEDAKAAELRMIVLYSVGGAAVITGGVLYYLGAKRSEILVYPTSGGGGVSYSTTF